MTTIKRVAVFTVTGFIISLAIALSAQAEDYYVELDKDNNVISTYSIKDGETLEKLAEGRVRLKVATAEDYALCVTDFSKYYEANKTEVDLAIANKPKTLEEQIAELKAKVDALEAKP